ncbi:MAG: LPS assembly lipoprotein LptE [Chitinophagales bacterium]
MFKGYAYIKSAVGKLTFLVLLAGIGMLGACKIYSFTGANIPADIKTVTIDLFQNRANNGPANIGQLITEKLKNKMVTEANLRQVNFDGDLVFKGNVVGYTFSSQAPTAQVQSGVNRLTITVLVTFQNNRYPAESWKQPETFSRYAEVNGSENLSAVETRLIDEINKQLVDDIFTKALVKW